MEQRMYIRKIRRFQIDKVLALIDKSKIVRIERARETAIKNGRWKESKPSFFPVKPTERYLLVLGTYGRLGLTPQELYSVRKIWLQTPDETFNLSVKTLWANLYKLEKTGLAESVIEGLTYRYFAKDEKFLDFSLRWVLGIVPIGLQPPVV
jgi:hypothetical protein